MKGTCVALNRLRALYAAVLAVMCCLVSVAAADPKNNPTPDAVQEQTLLQEAENRYTELKPSAFDLLHGLNIVYLYGFDWNLGQQERDVLTLEYYRNTSWGDLFMFVDITNLARATDQFPTEFYGEINPRFSFNKLLDADLSIGPVKEFFQSNSIELGSIPNKDFIRHLHGVGFGLDLPGFQFANVDLYLRNDPELEGVTWQVTLSWGFPFQIEGLPLSYGGFVDIAGPEDGSEFNVVSGTRLLLDVGPLLHRRPGKVFIGVEFAAWYNEFGIKDRWEFVPQLALQYSF